jgi:serralysin
LCEVCQAIANTSESVSGLSADCPASALDSGTSRGDTVITVSFVGSGNTANAIDGELTSEGWSSYEKQQFMAALATISNYVNLTFVETTDPNADFQLVLDDFGGSNTLGYFYMYNVVGYTGSTAGYFNSTGAGWNENGGLEAGGTGFSTIIHEALHGLGLDHPHDGDSILNGLEDYTNDYYYPFGYLGDYDLNQEVYTIMSYNGGYDGAPASDFYNDGAAGSPMALDIAILQEIYGANTTYNSGDNVYEIPDNDDAWISIWDTGGDDTVSYSGTKDVTIDLREATLLYEVGGGGFISAADGVAGGYTIANGAVIENASGGSGDDSLIGNDANNTLSGNGGVDTIDGGSGNDTLLGNSGGDIVSSTEGTNTIYGGSGFDDLNGGSDADTIFGGSGDDDITGGDGDDTLYGGRGDDTIEGGAGADIIIGGMGADTLIGSDLGDPDGDIDTFVFNAMSDSFDGNADTIIDFEAGIDQIDLSALGISGTDVTLSISDGDTTVRIDSNGDGVNDMEILLTGTVLTDTSDFVGL